MKNWQFFTLIGVIVLSVFIHFGINYYWWDWSPENFNNIGSPIGGIVSSIGVIITLIYLHHQNKVMLSQNLVPYYERFITRLQEKTLEDYPPFVYPLPAKKLHFMDKIKEIFILLERHPEYLHDVALAQNKQQLTIEYISNRSYYRFVAYLNSFIFFRETLNAIAAFVMEVENSKLTDEDKRLIRIEIKDVLLNGYMSFIERSESKLIPLVFLPSDPNSISFVQLEKYGFGEYHAFFKKALENIN